MYVREDYSLKRPNTELPSTTGAHEIGHALGMHHDVGIMSRSQDENRTNELSRKNIDEMMESPQGHFDLKSAILTWYEKWKNK